MLGNHERLFLAVPWDCLRFVIVVFPDHTHLLFMMHNIMKIYVWAEPYVYFLYSQGP